MGNNEIIFDPPKEIEHVFDKGIKETCKWSHDHHYAYHAYYETECGHVFALLHNEPFVKRDFRYCPYCAREINNIFF